MSEERLREYINDREYQEYKKTHTEYQEYERFCFSHRRDIENILEENQQLKERHYLIQGGRGNCKTLVLMLQKENEKYKSVLDEIREYIKGWQDFPHTNESTHRELRNLMEILDKVKE